MAESQYAAPSSPPGAEIKILNEDDHQQYLETELIPSPKFETPEQNLCLDTEIVEYSEPLDDMPTAPLCEYQPEVVLDSEDEEMRDSEVVNVAKGLADDQSGQRVTKHSMVFRKRQPEPLCERAENMSAISSVPTVWNSVAGNHMLERDEGASINSESSDEKTRLDSTTRINPLGSPEPGELTLANALDFVDHYLSSNRVDLSQGIDDGKVIREVSRPVLLSAKGAKSLAKKIARGIPDEEKGTFRWVDSDQRDGKPSIYSQKTEASSNFGGCAQKYVRGRKKSGNHANSSTGNECEEKILEGPGPVTVTINHNSNREVDVQSCVIRENVEACSGATHVEDMSFTGLNTRIAAEAMDALAYVPSLDCHFNDAHQPENELKDCPTDLTDNMAHKKNSLHGKDSGLQSKTIKSKQSIVSACNSNKIASESLSKHDEIQELDPVSGKLQKMMKSMAPAERQFGNGTNSSTCIRRVSLEDDHSQGDYIDYPPAAKETKKQNSDSRLTWIEDQSSKYRQKHDNIMEEGILRSKRKRNGVISDSFKFVNEVKHPDMPGGSFGVPVRSKLNCQVQVSPQLSARSSFLRLESWHYSKGPRGKRRHPTLNVQSHQSTTRNFCTEFVIVNEKDRNAQCTRNLESEDDAKKPCSHTRSLCSASQENSVEPGSAGGNGKLGKAHGKSVAQSGPEVAATVHSPEDIKFSDAHNTYNEHHKKPCNNSLPKSSILKKLNKLGVSVSTTGMIHKDLRQRRDMAYVRVLFSQHLDDTIMKQQKKILARLNVSIVSCSMEATHFIADKFTRTKNMLEAIALGKLVVTHLWLESCGQANCFIDEKNYILRDLRKEKKIGFTMPVSLARAKQQPLLKGKRVFITPHTKPDKKMISGLVTAVHGQVVDECTINACKNDIIPDDLLILSCEEDYSICHPFLERGIVVYSSEILLNGIVIQKLEPEKHQLFTNEGTRNHPNTCKRFEKVYRRRQDLNHSNTCKRFGKVYRRRRVLSLEHS